MISTALTAWEIRVPKATPATPMWNTTTSRRSKKMFKKQQMIKKYNGLLESPTALKIPEPIL